MGFGVWGLGFGVWGLGSRADASMWSSLRFAGIVSAAIYTPLRTLIKISFSNILLGFI